MGDFNNNAYVRNEGYDYLLSKGLKDTYNLSTTCDDGITVKGAIAGWEDQRENKRLDLILVNKEINVIGPSLPKYITKIINNFEIVLNLVVIPKVVPQVAKAENTSNTISLKDSSG